MFSIGLHQVVDAMVDHHLLRRVEIHDNEALHFHLDLRMSFYLETNGKVKEKTVSRGLHLLYYCPKGYSYVSVFSGITLSPFGRIKEVESWKFEGCHDSCWRDVRTMTELYFQMAEEVIAAFPKKLKLAPRPQDLHEHNSFAMFGKLFEWVPVEVKKDPEDPNNYRKTVTLK